MVVFIKLYKFIMQRIDIGQFSFFYIGPILFAFICCLRSFFMRMIKCADLRFVASPSLSKKFYYILVISYIAINSFVLVRVV